jgi:FkbM family methyltransferase
LIPRIDELSVSERAAHYARFSGSKPARLPFEIVRDPQRQAQTETLHTAEYFYITQSALHSRRDYVFVSLGAAPGEWPIVAERAYHHVRPRGRFSSISLEGDAGHVETIKALHAEAGLDPGTNIVRHAVASAKDGLALFPIVNAKVDFGASIASFAEREDDLKANIHVTDEARLHREMGRDGAPLEFQKVEALSIASILAPFSRVDFLHCDIQGAELDVVAAGIVALDEKVALCCIETHHSNIDYILGRIFWWHGWFPLCLVPAEMSTDGHLRTDGHLIVGNLRLLR